MSYCAACHGYRLSPQALSVKVGGEDGLHISGQTCPLQIIGPVGRA